MKEFLTGVQIILPWHENHESHSFGSRSKWGSAQITSKLATINMKGP